MEHGGRLIAKTMASGEAMRSPFPEATCSRSVNGCRSEGIELVDVRQQQAAVFAAEGIRQGDPAGRKSRR